MDLTAGDKLGAYTIEKLLGTGGMGKVYLAHDEGLKRRAAIKVLQKRCAENELYVRRFQVEAQSIAKLNHPNIVQIYHVDVACDTPYMAMEYIDGLPLDFLLKQKGKLSWQEALTITAQVAAALACTHEQGIIHRDIKPSNILVDQKLGVHVTDFGIARVLDAETRMTAEQDTIGTPCYMSPEQCGVAEVQPASDLFSLGVTLYEMISGKLPLYAETSMGMMNKIVSEPPPNIGDEVPDLPPLIPIFIDTLMAKKVDHRYTDANQILEDLNEFRAGNPVSHLTLIRKKSGAELTGYELAPAGVGGAVVPSAEQDILSTGTSQALVGDLMDVPETKVSARALYEEKPPLLSYWPSWATWVLGGIVAIVTAGYLLTLLPTPENAPQAPEVSTQPPVPSEHPMTPDGRPWPRDANGELVPALPNGYPAAPPGGRAGQNGPPPRRQGEQGGPRPRRQGGQGGPPPPPPR